MDVVSLSTCRFVRGFSRQFTMFSDFYPYKVNQNVSERRFLIEYKVFLCPSI